MAWIKGQEHIDRLAELQTLLGNAAPREYGDQKDDGLRDRWSHHLRKLYLIGCLVYLEDVFGCDSHWKKSSAISSYPHLLRQLEGLRCVRNCIVHNASRINPGRSKCETIIRELDTDIAANRILGEVRQDVGKPVEALYEIDPRNDEIIIPNANRVCWLVIQYLIVEGKVE